MENVLPVTKQHAFPPNQKALSFLLLANVVTEATLYLPH
jgi:hypothetical protein